MKLQARTTYQTNGGQLVHIAGPSNSDPSEGQAVFWSIAGDWYAEDGRRATVYCRLDGALVYELLSFEHIASIKTEDHDPDWWEGVVTERKKR